MSPTSKPGQLIVLEGMDSSGKSTASIYLTEALNKAGHATLATREMGGTQVGSALRALAFTPREDGEVIDPVTRLFLAFASRIQNLKTIIAPTLAKGINVVCDRFSDSTFVYQGKEDNLNYLIKDMEAIEELKYLGKRPDHLLFFTLSPETAILRHQSRAALDNTQYKGDLDKTKRIATYYRERMREMSVKHPNPIHLIDAEQSLAGVHHQLDTFVKSFKQQVL